jgi:hypothetical protein
MMFSDLLICFSVGDLSRLQFFGNGESRCPIVVKQVGIGCQQGPNIGFGYLVRALVPIERLLRLIWKSSLTIRVALIGGRFRCGDLLLSLSLRC